MSTIQKSQLAREPPILRLSPALRRQIYSHIHEALGSKPCNLHLHGGNGEAALGIPALLLSCRRVYEEASGILYSTNFFDIKCKGAGSLERIRNLRDSSLSSLTELKIVLNAVSCHLESCNRCCDNYDRYYQEGCFDVGHKMLHDQALRPSHVSAINLIADWRLAAAYIWRRVQPSKLNISFVCDFDPQDPRTISAASLAVVPLINLLPLRGCHIRLCRRPHYKLGEIARNAVFRACGIVAQGEPTFTSTNATTDSKASMLMKLPRELRFRILEYTDLITPWPEIEWRQEDKRYLRGPTYCDDEQLACADGGHHACQFRSCWTDFREREYIHVPRESRPRVGCFCRVRHAAFSFNCRCWSPPTDLFLVCHALCKDAQVVFFSGHRFEVSDRRSGPARPTSGTGECSSYRFAVVEFLRDVVPVDIIRQIRSLQVTMRTCSCDAWPWEGSRALSEWKDTVQFMKDNMNMEGLTLGLYLSDWSGRPDKVHEIITKPQARKVLQPYFRILAPLAGLGEEGFKEFYVHIWLPMGTQGPWYLDRWSTGTPRWSDMGEMQREQILSNRARRLVMGSRYSEEPEGELSWSSEELEDVLWNHES